MVPMSTSSVQSAPTLRFVLLQHSVSDNTHWDLMFEVGSVLATWQLASDPTVTGAALAPSGVPGRRIADHRAAYLDYEGPISGGRGCVRQVDAGRYRLLERSPDCWVVELHGGRLLGVYELPAGAQPGVVRARQ